MIFLRRKHMIDELSFTLKKQAFFWRFSDDA